MRGVRVAAAALLSLTAVALLTIEAASWAKSARLGLLYASSSACALRLDTLSDVDRSAGLRPGDILLLPLMDPASRTAAVFHYTPTQAGRAGQTVRAFAQRGSSRVTVSYVLRHTDRTPVFLAQLAFKSILIALALVLLWRGHDRASLILALWCFGVSLALPDAWWGALPLGGRIAGGTLTAVLWTVSPLLLYLVVEAIATGVSRTARIIARGAMLVLMLPGFIADTLDASAQAISGCWIVPIRPLATEAMFASAQLVIVAFFGWSYLRTTGLAKQRVRWVFWSFLLSRVGVLANLFDRIAPHPIHLSGFEWASVLIFPIGCTYAILRHRIIDVSFVLNRTLVYTVLTTAVVGIFILLEDLLHALAAGRGIGLAVEVTVALILGFSFNALHKYVEGAIERSLFRAKHEAAKALQRLADEAAFTEAAESLLQRAVVEIRTYSGAAATAIYERGDNAYYLTAFTGAEKPPDVVDVDDLAFVRLRKTLTQVDLSETQSALGTDGLAFAFTVRGQPTGALICRRRPNGESYAPDEVALLRTVAHDVGAELYAIRARKQGELLDALLSGSLNLGDARTKRMASPSAASPL